MRAGWTAMSAACNASLEGAQAEAAMLRDGWNALRDEVIRGMSSRVEPCRVSCNLKGCVTR